MHFEKCAALKKELAGQPEPLLVEIARFFDGNDDSGSIGCNLAVHPGVETFRTVLVGLLDRSDVKAVYAQVAEADPGPEAWPFCDRVFVAGVMPLDELRNAVKVLLPDESGAAEGQVPGARIVEKHGGPVHYIWWD